MGHVLEIYGRPLLCEGLSLGISDDALFVELLYQLSQTTRHSKGASKELKSLFCSSCYRSHRETLRGAPNSVIESIDTIGTYKL
jgi:hypothetical protein